MGFEINPFDPSVANKLVDGKQMIVRWHVDDLMINHVNQDKILKFVKCIKDIYGDNLAKNCPRPLGGPQGGTQGSRRVLS
jgi:hypothetical protein